MLVNSLYNFIKSDATMNKLQEANTKAYPVKESEKVPAWRVSYRSLSNVYYAANKGEAAEEFRLEMGDKVPAGAELKFANVSNEGKLPSDNGKDNSIIANPEEQIQMLSEKEKAAKKVTQKSAEKEADAAVNPDIKTDNAGVTAEPEKTDIQKDLEKETPTDKLTQDKAGQDPAASANMKKAKEVKKEELEVTGVEKVKEAKINETVKTVEEAIAWLGSHQDGEFDNDNIYYYSKLPEGAKWIVGLSYEKLHKAVRYGYFKDDAGLIAQVNTYIQDLGESKNKVKEAKMTVEQLAKELGVGVEVVKAIQDALRDDMMKEGKLPSDNGKDNSIIANPEEQIQMLSEEKVLTTVSDEKVAKDIAAKYPGSRIVVDNEKKQWIVMVKEEKKCTCSGKCHESYVEGDKIIYKDNLPGEVVKVAKGMVAAKMGSGKTVQYMADDPELKKVAEKKEVKEDVTVTIDNSGKETTVTASDDGSISVDTSAPKAPSVGEPVVEPPVEDDAPDFFEGEEEMKDEEADEMAEKILVVEHLETLKKTTKKQANFIKEVKGLKMGKKNKQKVGKALKQLKKKS